MINTKIKVFPFKRNQILKDGFESICSVRQIDGTAGGRGPPAVPSYCLTVNIFEFVLGNTRRNIEKYENFGLFAVLDKHLGSREETGGSL